MWVRRSHPPSWPVVLAFKPASASSKIRRLSSALSRDGCCCCCFQPSADEMLEALPSLVRDCCALAACGEANVPHYSPPQGTHMHLHKAQPLAHVRRSWPDSNAHIHACVHESHDMPNTRSRTSSGSSTNKLGCQMKMIMK